MGLHRLRQSVLAASLWLAMAHGVPVQAEQAASAVLPATTSTAQPARKAVPAKTIPGKKKKKKKTVEPVPPPTPVEEEPLGEIIGVVDAPRDYLAEKFVDLVSGIDRFFGDDRNYQESRDSVLQLEAYRLYGYGGEHKVVYTGRAKVHLPNTEKRLHVLIETDPDKNTNPDSARRQTVQPVQRSTPASYGAGVRYEQVEEERWHYSTDGGLKFQGLNTTPFARARVSYTDRLGEWQMKAAETLFWFNTIGAGETTQVDFERTLSPTLLFRATSNATWLHDKQVMDLRQDFTSFHTLDDRRALMYQASIVGVSRPNEHVTDYVLLALYRYRLHRNWMFIELSPQVHFPKERQFRSSGAFFLRLEMLLDDSK
jgi:hypothetical protein